jgi:hypothetical protein
MDGSAQEELEQEIVSENVRVVSGDGVETASGRQDVNKEMKEDEQVEQTDEEEDSSSQEEYSSWGRSRNGSILQPLTRSEKDTKPAQSTEAAPSNLRRIRSALSLLSSGSEPPITEPLPTRNHRRTPSGQSSRPSYSRRFSGHAQMPSLNISEYATPAPPSIRRKNSSHPDITSLVEHWTISGPANQTMMYKPHTYS